MAHCRFSLPRAAELPCQTQFIFDDQLGLPQNPQLSERYGLPCSPPQARDGSYSTAPSHMDSTTYPMLINEYRFNEYGMPPVKVQIPKAFDGYAFQSYSANAPPKLSRMSYARRWC